MEQTKIKPDLFYRGCYVYLGEIFRGGKFRGFGAVVTQGGKPVFACSCDRDSADPELGVIAAAMEEIDRRTK